MPRTQPVQASVPAGPDVLSRSTWKGNATKTKLHASEPRKVTAISTGSDFDFRTAPTQRGPEVEAPEPDRPDALGSQSPTRYGQSGRPTRPAVSGWPVMRFAFWTAWPAAPFPRLSRAATAKTSPVSRLTVYATKTTFEPVAHFVRGLRPPCTGTTRM